MAGAKRATKGLGPKDRGRLAFLLLKGPLRSAAEDAELARLQEKRRGNALQSTRN